MEGVWQRWNFEIRWSFWIANVRGRILYNCVKRNGELGVLFYI